MNKFSKEYKDYLQSPLWDMIRMAKLRKVDFKCERCGHGCWLQVHHKDYDMEFGKERSEDLIVLCNACHMNMHSSIGNEVKNEKAYKPKALIVF